jgi:TetR/AcrR family transcriptional regulator, transcriptional repressor for nem operon
MTTAQTLTPSKRERLIEAAKLAFYRQGFATTTLADVAALAEVPLGNVYYYFRAKDDLLAAVIDAHLRALRAQFARWERDPDPRQRLSSLLQAEREGKDELARYGCPYGSLCQEMGKGDTPLAAMAAQLLEAQIEWAAQQLRLMGKDAAEARELAVDLLASLQGAFLLTCSFRSPALLERQLDRLQSWIESL